VPADQNPRILEHAPLRQLHRKFDAVLHGRKVVRSAIMHPGEKFKRSHMTECPAVSRTVSQKTFPVRSWNQPGLNVPEHVRVEDRLQAQGINKLQHGTKVQRKNSPVCGGWHILSRLLRKGGASDALCLLGCDGAARHVLTYEECRAEV